ncbi:hypothetical protein [Sphingomonas oleivorans]|uniref:hypothetical protein n=1 Tax=Sphingomonas oleivorans TaxID=1735121 RepID=UPI001056F9D2|nr:hypothetical protein [Sphingomonas oleivorans]
MGEDQVKKIAAELNEGARLALLAWPKGTPTWFDVVECTPRNALGRFRGYRQTVLPLEQAGLAEHDGGRLLPDGRRESQRYHLTRLGHRVRAYLRGHP